MNVSPGFCYVNCLCDFFMWFFCCGFCSANFDVNFIVNVDVNFDANVIVNFDLNVVNF